MNPPPAGASASRAGSLAACELRAGPITLRFEPASLWAREWRGPGGSELLRAVYPAFRDTDWGTPRPLVAWRRRLVEPDRFDLELEARYGGASPYFRWLARLTGEPDGTVAYSVTGTALKTCRTSRAGFCVLHPPEVAGRTCRIEHVDGSIARRRFPARISPHQPFFDVRAIRHEPEPSFGVTVRMEGDTFEMEDQRNWTDASFKTYCRPLALPFPFTLRRGAIVAQRVTVRLERPGAPGRPRTARDAGLSRLVLRRRRQPLPELGLMRPAHHRLTPAPAAALRAAGIRHLRVDLDPGSRSAGEELRAAATDVVRIGGGAGLEVALHVGRRFTRFDSFARDVAAEGLGFPLRWLVFDADRGLTTGDLFRRVAEAWRRHQVPGLIGSGAAGGFVDFNRNRPVPARTAFAAFGLSPQVHAFDERSMMETMAIHPLVVTQARRMAHGLPVAVSPITLYPSHRGRARPDPRLHQPFGASWTLASIAALAGSGAFSLTYHQATGPGGVFSIRRKPASPIQRVWHAIGSFGASEASVLEASGASDVGGIALWRASRLRVLLANLRPVPSLIRLAGLPAPPIRAELLTGATVRMPKPSPFSDPTSFDAPVRLPGYGVLQLDFDQAK